MAPGTYFLSRTRAFGNRKITKIAKKKAFLTEPFFKRFLEREKPLGLKRPQINGPRLELKNYVSV